MASDDGFNSDNKIFYLICFVVNTAIFAIFTFFLILFMIKVKGKLNKEAILMISTFSICIISRFINWTILLFVYEIRYIDYLEIFITIEEILIWIMLIYFVFEIKEVKDKLESSTVEQFKTN